MTSEIVSTKCGKVKGKVVNLKDGKPVHVYRNIPFAKPPLGNLRFMPPQPAAQWEGVKDGTIVGNLPMCIASFGESMDAAFPVPEPDDSKPVYNEDCLHVSVYTPDPKKGKNLPVMVWLYGGGFQMGCERWYDGSVLAGMNDVVVVIPNYRVGVFGFLSLGENSICTGNAGLLDQRMALKWVQENVEYFGGDKNNVTIFGESAGAGSVHLNVISPTTRGLFHKAISHSGTANMPGAFQEAASLKESVKVFVKHLKIEANDDAKILEALQNIPADDLVNATAALLEKKVYFSPIVDGVFLTKFAEEYLKEKNFAKVPYIFGCNSSEGQGLLAMSAGANFSEGITEEEARAAFYVPITEKGIELCKKKYLREEEGERKFSKFLGDVLGDSSFIAPTVYCANTHSEAGADIYCYYGDFQLRMHHDLKYGAEVTQKADWCVCDHGDDIYMTFGSPFSTKEFPRGAKFSEEEAKISQAFMTYITNFAKTGNPNKGKKVDFEWPKYKRGGEQLVLKHPLTKIKNLAEEEVKFWTEVMPPYLKKEE